MANVVAQGISRKQIRAFTKYVRELCGMTDRMYKGYKTVNDLLWFD